MHEVDITIPRSVPDNWTEVDACLAGPDPATAETQAAAMLSTVRWKD